MRSKFEKRIAKELDDAGVSYEYEQFSYAYTEPLRRNSIFCSSCSSTDIRRSGWYTPDFFLDSGIIIETKGRFTAADRRKMLAVREAHKDLEDIKLCFMRDNKIHRSSKTHYSDWAMENGFDYSIGNLKDEWLR